jgi:hypothetical protein
MTSVSYPTKSFNYSVNSEYSLTSKHVTKKSTKKDLSYDNSKWLKKVLPTNVDPQKFTVLDYEEEHTSIDSNDFTHTGLIQYLAIGWADEKGIILRPDMFHHTICCEIAQEIIANPKNYSSLYTNTLEKKTILIVTTGDDDEFIRLLDERLNKQIINTEFKELMTDLKFSSQPENYEIVKKICFANSATPFFNYAKTKCGFPSITIPDILEDWTKLYVFILKMKNIFEVEFKKNTLCYSSKIIDYLEKTKVNIKEIIDNFGNQQNLKNKLQKIFYIEDEQKCGSGHNFPYFIHGWIKNFYLNKKPFLKDYPSHLPYIPYKFVGVGNYSIVSGIISSTLKNNVLEPKYEKIVFRITNQKLFDIIKN